MKQTKEAEKSEHREAGWTAIYGINNLPIMINRYTHSTTSMLRLLSTTKETIMINSVLVVITVLTVLTIAALYIAAAITDTED